MTVQAVRGLEEPVAARVRVRLGQGFVGRIDGSREPLVVDDVSIFPVANPGLREKLHSVAGVPLLVGDQLLGVVHIGGQRNHGTSPHMTCNCCSRWLTG